MQQTIEASTFNAQLVIQTYDLPLITRDQIRTLTGFFQSEFPRFPSGFLNIFISAVPVPADDKWIIYILNTKLSENVLTCNISFFGNDHFSNLKYILIKFIRELKEGLAKIEGASEESITVETESTTDNSEAIEIVPMIKDTPMPPLPETFDVDELLREFTAEEKKKKGLTPPPRMKKPSSKKRKKSPPKDEGPKQ